MNTRLPCDVAHATNFTTGRQATWDLGRHVQAAGRGRVRYLCDDCAKGLYLGRQARRLDTTTTEGDRHD